MEHPKIKDFLNKPCKFRLRSGKDVYGVVWQKSNGTEQEYFFASTGEYRRFSKNILRDDNEYPPQIGLKLNPVEIVDAQYLSVIT